MFVVEDFGSRESWRVGSGGLESWDSSDVLGGVWGDLRVCGVGNFGGGDAGFCFGFRWMNGGFWVGLVVEWRECIAGRWWSLGDEF